jgi:hypothetical protein
MNEWNGASELGRRSVVQLVGPQAAKVAPATNPVREKEGKKSISRLAPFSKTHCRPCLSREVGVE